MHLRAAALDRLVLAELSPRAEERLRAHLRGCLRCRTAYEELLLLHRALAGDLVRPTAAEEERDVRRALAGAGLRPPARAPALDRLVVWHPWLAAMTAAAVLGLAIAGLRAALGLAPAALRPSSTAELARRAGPAGRLLHVRGEVRVGGRPAKEGASVLAGESVEVGGAAQGAGPPGAAEMTVARGGVVRLFPGTALDLGAGGERVQLATGKIWCLPEHNGRPFTVATDQGEVRTIGTSFVVERSGDGDTDVRVLQGTVEVEDREHRGSLRLRAELQTRLHAGRAPDAPRRYVPTHDRDEWNAIVSDFVRLLRRILDGR
ncbi:MAG: FecR domain-containing protein [Myxococcales bacterium]